MTERIVAETEGHRRPYLLFGLMGIILLLLGAANLIQLVLINPTAQENKSDIAAVTRENSEGICAIVRQTADSYRTQTVTKDGEVEPISHYRRRLSDQLFTLKLIRNRRCPGVGEHFQKRIQLAILEVEALLLRTAPAKDREVARGSRSGLRVEAATQTAGEAGAPARETGPSPPLSSDGGDGAGHEGSKGAPGSQPAPQHHQGSAGGAPAAHHPHPGGGDQEGSAPAPAAQEPTPAPAAPAETATGSAGPEQTAPPPEASKPEPAPKEESTGVNVCVQNPLLPLCVGVKGSSVTVE